MEIRLQTKNCSSDIAVVPLVNIIQYLGLSTFVAMWKPSSSNDLLDRFGKYVTTEDFELLLKKSHQSMNLKDKKYYIF